MFLEEYPKLCFDLSFLRGWRNWQEIVFIQKTSLQVLFSTLQAKGSVQKLVLLQQFTILQGVLKTTRLPYFM